MPSDFPELQYSPEVCSGRPRNMLQSKAQLSKRTGKRRLVVPAFSHSNLKAFPSASHRHTPYRGTGRGNYRVGRLLRERENFWKQGWTAKSSDVLRNSALRTRSSFDAFSLREPVSTSFEKAVDCRPQVSGRSPEHDGMKRSARMGEPHETRLRAPNDVLQPEPRR
jgi:hypothetical protein